MVIYSEHPVFSLLFLISSFILSSFILFALECEFLALLFITIYVGAIAILFLFAVMMLDTKLANLSQSKTKYIPIGAFFGLAFLAPVIYEILMFFKASEVVPEFNLRLDFARWLVQRQMRTGECASCVPCEQLVKEMVEEITGCPTCGEPGPNEVVSECFTCGESEPKEIVSECSTCQEPGSKKM